MYAVNPILTTPSVAHTKDTLLHTPLPVSLSVPPSFSNRLPFDFERRRLSVVLQRKSGTEEERRPLLVCKVSALHMLAGVLQHSVNPRRLHCS